MDVFEAIERRHSYRGEFTGAEVSREDLQKIVQAGLQAPSGCNAQTPTFVIIDDPAAIGQIAEIAPSPVVKGARALIACVAEHRPVYKDMSFGIEDCSAAIENMLLAITALGYATVWIDGALRAEGRAARVAKLLGVPQDKELRVILPLGVPVEQREQKEKLPFAQRAWFERYGSA